MIPRSEHPDPQFQRDNWLNLNGAWEFEIDQAKSGYHQGWQNEDRHFTDRITVPFCPESKLSGIEHRDFINACWYRKDFELTKEQLAGDVIFHIGACDYHTRVFINGIGVIEHKGGYTPVCGTVTKALHPGLNRVTVYVEDDVRNPMQTRGKQSEHFYSHGCDYTRTTGIWQTVWLEFVPKTRIAGVKFFPEISGHVTVQANLIGKAPLSVRVSYQGKLMGEASQEAFGVTCLSVALSEVHLWEVGNGRLYDVEITFGEDAVRSYFGLRSVRLDGMKFLLNEQSVFQRLVLDQGFYPEGVYTAPTEEDMIRDITISQEAGFNGARLHQKTFEPRFLYHCDRLGYLVWDEYGNWGADTSDFRIMEQYIPEWLEEIERDFNHPSIVGWCPFNETWDYMGRRQNDAVLRDIYRITKAADPTRPCIDTSGVYHVETDIFDVHDYDQDPQSFRRALDLLAREGTMDGRYTDRQPYLGQPVFVSEYGGIQWPPDTKDGWGYGNAPTTEKDFLDRYRKLAEAILDNPKIMGFCYTQLYDIEQEQNGLYYYDRTPKFDMTVIKAFNSKKAAIE